MFRIPVERRPQKPVPQERTAVTGLVPGCGASFAAGLEVCRLAALDHGKGRFADSVPDHGFSCTLAELGTPYFYNALNMEKRFADGSFVFYEELLQKRRPLLGIKNLYRGINMLLRAPQSVDFPSALCACKMPGEQVVFDLSGAPDELLDEVLPEMDRIIIVIDPLPTKLLAGYERLEKLRLLYPDAQLLVNKMNKGVHSAQLTRFLGTGSFSSLPFYPSELVYRAEYNCVLPAELIHRKNTSGPFSKGLHFL